MSTPTANGVILLLSQLGRELDAKQGEISRLDEEAVRARSRFEVTFSGTFLKAEGAIDVRKHQAIVDTAGLKLDAEIADQKLRAAGAVNDSMLSSVDRVTTPIGSTR